MHRKMPLRSGYTLLYTNLSFLYEQVGCSAMVYGVFYTSFDIYQQLCKFTVSTVLNKVKRGICFCFTIHVNHVNGISLLHDLWSSVYSCQMSSLGVERGADNPPLGGCQSKQSQKNETRSS